MIAVIIVLYNNMESCNKLLYSKVVMLNHYISCTFYISMLIMQAIPWTFMSFLDIASHKTFVIVHVKEVW